jgi:UDP:flavonoid glycosyltransferase YjiC (YdhE family)
VRLILRPDRPHKGSNAGSGIRVNIVCPGPTERTRLIENLTSSQTEERERTLNVIPMHRMGEPEEVAEAVQVGIDSLSYKLTNRKAASVLKRYGKSPRPLSELCLGNHILKIIPSIPELDGTDPLRKDVRYVGSLLTDTKSKGKAQSVHPEKGFHYIFVYVGTGSIEMPVIKKILPRVFTKDKKYICHVASETIHKEQEIGSVKFSSYVPAGQLLPYCDWTICHGGHNTIMQSLLHNVPMMIFPGPIFERRINAGQVEKNGSGFMGELRDFNKDWIESKLSLHDEAAKNASFICEKIKKYGGAIDAVKAIEEFCG